MTYRILIDENTSPTVVALLEEAGHDAVHVTAALEEGATDAEITTYARDHEYVLLTHDPDFLRQEVAGDVPILYYSDDSLGPSRIARLVDRLAGYVPDVTDLPPITNLGDWSEDG